MEAESAVQSVGNAADQATVAVLQDKLTGLEQALADVKAQQEQLATQGASLLGQAFAKLTNRVAGNAPFVEALDALTAEAPDVPGVEVLRPLASTGIATPADLAAELEEIAKGLAKPATADGTESSGGGIMGAPGELAAKTMLGTSGV